MYPTCIICDSRVIYLTSLLPKMFNFSSYMIVLVILLSIPSISKLPVSHRFYWCFISGISIFFVSVASTFHLTAVFLCIKPKKAISNFVLLRESIAIRSENILYVRSKKSGQNFSPDQFTFSSYPMMTFVFGVPMLFVLSRLSPI